MFDPILNISTMLCTKSRYTSLVFPIESNVPSKTNNTSVGGILLHTANLENAFTLQNTWIMLRYRIIPGAGVLVPVTVGSGRTVGSVRAVGSVLAVGSVRAVGTARAVGVAERRRTL